MSSKPLSKPTKPATQATPGTKGYHWSPAQRKKFLQTAARKRKARIADPLGHTMAHLTHATDIHHITLAKRLKRAIIKHIHDTEEVAEVELLALLLVNEILPQRE